MTEIETVKMEIDPEDFLLKNRKLIQMLEKLDKAAGDYLEMIDHPSDTEALFVLGLRTRDLSHSVLGSTFYADGAQLIEKACKMGYITRRQLRRNTEGRRGNPNLVMNYITEKGRRLLEQVNDRK